MADNLIFPIGFDLDKAVADASKEWDGTYATKLEKALAKKPVSVKLKLDTKNLDSLDAVKKRLAELKIEPITPATKTAIKELAGELRTLAKALEQVQKYSVARASASPDAVRASKIRVNEERAQAQAALAAQRTAKAEENLAAARLKAERAANTHATATRNANNAYAEQSTYLDRLIKRMAVYWSVAQVGNFLTSVREVTAQFELQRISLGAIIQDQARANQLFEEIKTFALKSPVKILDLTKYTKQLAAYKIGVEDLFDTTKRLTDISVGLGVSMDRIVLMYGQIRATGYLRASEVRQATEAGIPLVEELAKKISKANGELTTAADVMEMISKRAISFDMVKEVFDDMTSAGGIFYNMQEKQGNTLYGMWQKLGDAAAMMYDQIGNTSFVNEGMKMTIQTLRYLMLHWKQVGTVVGGVTTAIAVNVIATRKAALASAAATAANGAHVVSLQRKIAALRLEQASLSATSIAQRISTAAAISATQAQISAAMATNMFSKALYGLKAMLLSNPLTALAVALTTIIALLIQSESELDKLNGKLQDIDRDYDASGKKSVDRFKELVKAVEENVDGSKAQKEALDELNRTYGNILGSEALELDSLKALGGQYGELINLIDAYNAKKRGEEKETAIKSSYATILDEEKDDLMDYLNQAGMSAERQAEFIQTINDKMLDGKDAVTATDEAFKEFADDLSSFDSAGNIFNIFSVDKLADAWGIAFRQMGGFFGGQGLDYLYNYARALEGQNEALDKNEKETRLAADALGVYSAGVDGLNKAFKNLDWSSMDALQQTLQSYNAQHPENKISIPMKFAFDPAKAESEYEKMVEVSNMQIYAIFENLKSIASSEGVEIPKEFYKQAKSVVDGNKDFSFIDWAKMEEQFKGSPKALAAIRASKQLYESIAPSDDTIRVFNRKFITLADSMDVSLDRMQRYLMKSGDNLGEHRKNLSDEVTNLLKQIARLEWTKKMLSMFGLPADAVEEKIQESQQTLKLLQSMIADIPDIEAIGKKKKKKGSDPRLGILQEMVSTLKQVNKEYDDLAKKEGNTKALKDTQKVYEATFKNMQKLAQQYKFKLPDFGVPTDTASLTKYLEAIKKAMAKLPKSQKAVLALQVDIDKLNIDEKQKQIEEELKRLADRISRTKTAKEFYDKILSTTGDLNLAASVTMSIYGDTGEGLFESIAKQIRDTFKSGDIGVNLEIGAAIDSAIDVDNKRINYGELAKIYEKYQDKIIEKNRSTAENIVKEGQKTAASNIATWEKELAKAKDYEEQRTDIINRETQRRAEIIKSYDYTPEQKEEKLKLSRKKQEEGLAKVNFEEFTKSEDYIKIFENLDNTATSSLKRLRKELEALIVTNQNLSPENMKTLVKAIEDIDEQISGRGFGNDMVQSVKDFISATKNLKIAKQELVEAQAEYKAQEPQLNADIDAAKAEAIAAQEALNKLKIDEFATDNQVTAAQLRLNAAAQKVAETEQKKAKAVDKVEKAEKKIAGYKDEQKKATSKFMKDLERVAKETSEIASFLGEVKDLLDISEDSAAGLVFDSAISSLQTMTKAINVASAAQAIFNTIAAANPLVAAATAAIAVGLAIGNWIKGNKVRKANKEIEKQQDLLDQLDYTYGRLEKAADKAFGMDYMNNYQQQIKNLEAQQQAYLKQADAERSKGKDKDNEKIKEYEKNARETADKIKDMQDDLVAHFTGSSKTDIARQMAKSWIDARASMSDTFAAIKGDYQDMLKNMLVEGAAARVIENALSPLWKQIEDAYKSNNPEEALDKALQGMDVFLNAANNGMEVLWKALEARGYDMKKMLSTSDTEMTGIKREIATASEESITGLAAAINTQNYYISHVPNISENVAAIRALMEVGGATGVVAPTTGWTDWQQQAMDNYNAIARNTADTVIECRRAANACENAVTKISRAMKIKGATVGFNTFINS